MATYTAVAAGGNWSTDATWGGGGHPVAGDTANINATMTGTVTVDAAAACAVLNLTANGGTLAFGNFNITCTGNITLGGTITAGTGGLVVTGASSMNSGGVTFPGILTFSYAGTVTLAGGNNWINTGLVTFTAATIVNKTTAETLTTNGGLTMTAATGAAPTAIIILGGGTWSGTGKVNNNLTFAGNSTVSGTVTYGTGTLLYTSGTITTTGSTLTTNLSCTLNTAGITWNAFACSANGTITLASNLTMSGRLNPISNTVFAGVYTIQCADFSPSGGFGTLTFASGSTLIATNSMTVMGSAIATSHIKSGTASSTFALTYQGTAANCIWVKMQATDVDASSSAQGIDNWYGGTLTRTTNITNRTSADIGGTTSNVFGIM